MKRPALPRRAEMREAGTRLIGSVAYLEDFVPLYRPQY